MYYVCLLQNVERADEFYLGYSSDLKQRVHAHNTGENRSTRGREWRVAYDEAYLSEDAARERERRLKSNGRMKQFLLERVKKHLMKPSH